jgi:hypothetical protein
MRTLVLAALTVSFVAWAQEPQPVAVRDAVALSGPSGNVAFVAGQMIGGPPVTNAPYSAQAVTESTQTLADGNRIVHKSSSMQYRDSEGRERREETLGGLSTLAPDAEIPRVVFIHDPVAGVSYSLHPDQKVAAKMPAPQAPGDLPQQMALFAGLAPGFPPPLTDHPTFFSTPTPGQTMPVQSMVRIERSGGNVTAAEGTAATGGKSESLGTQMIEGVQAQGTRVTETIPAGRVGNEQPIQVVNENWYSPDLKMMVMTKYSDPRSGEQVYRLTNISRTEPDRSLFEVPADYTMMDTSKGPVFFKKADRGPAGAQQ